MEDLNQSDASDAIENMNELFDGIANGASTLSQDLKGLQDEFQLASQASEGLSKSLSKDIASAMRGLVVDGDSLSDTFRSLALSISSNAVNSAVNPIIDGFSDWAGSAIAEMMPFENGGVFQGGQVQAFARGGIVNSPTNFPMSDGVGLMGEAGPEAIMPLKRGSDGKLGVAMGDSKSNAVNVVFNITTNDAQSFARSQSQITAKLSRVLAQSNSNR